MSRIPRELPAHDLTAYEIEYITSAVFISPQPRQSDLMLVLSASATSGLWEPAAQLLRQGYAFSGDVPGRIGHPVSS